MGSSLDGPDAWQQAVAQVWAGAAARPGEDVLADISTLVQQRAPDARGTFELAGAYDFAGHEAQAEGLYREAMRAGLDDERHQQAVIQLASTLRNLDRPKEAVRLLRTELTRSLTGRYASAARAFLALALLDTGADRGAAITALEGLVECLPVYQRPLRHYLAELAGVPTRENDQQPPEVRHE